MNYIGGKEFKG